MSNFNFVTCFCLAISAIEAARILAVFPLASISHQVVFRPLTQALAKRGHEVVVITTDPAFPKGGAPPNLTEIDVHDISYNIWKEKIMITSKGNEDDAVAQMNAIMDAIISGVDAQLRVKEVREIVEGKNQKFDLVLTEACVRTALVFAHIYKVPAIQVGSFGGVKDNYVTFGVPMHPLLYPSHTRQRLNNLTIWQKVTELYNHYRAEYIYDGFKVNEHEMLKKHFGNDLPTIDELHDHVHLILLNAYPIFEGIRPVPPNVIYMGGILMQNPEKELPTDLKSYLDASKNGVIYVSFGTNVDPSLLPPETIQILVKTFSKLPYNVFWKWNKDELPGRTDNIKISKWLPQSDLLKHPNVKLFITQGGLQSTNEAIAAGVPLIGMPMLGDQWYNVERYEYHRIGIRVDLDTLTVEKFTNTINAVINDDSYRRNIIKLRDVMADEPMKPLDRAVWWTEYVLRHGGAKHLRSPGARISWAEYLELELVFTV
ncbi:UDP-glucosyltransferase 2-like [Anticarsia gemmatalis]|uniref:UDP-glucosyltransferase 2-like n=1 Tax=Anticarsia gemmatalis TaxID=129554 RepID=UPI003F763F61